MCAYFFSLYMSNGPEPTGNMCSHKIWWDLIIPKNDTRRVSNVELLYFTKQRKMWLPWVLSPPTAFSSGGAMTGLQWRQSGQQQLRPEWAEGRGSLFIRSNSTFLKHFWKVDMVWHLVLCACGGEDVRVCLFSIEIFLRTGGAHPTRTRLKAKKLCSERC